MIMQTAIKKAFDILFLKERDYNTSLSLND